MGKRLLVFNFIKERVFTKEKIILNSIIQGIGHLFSILFSIISVSVLTRYLGANSYGQYITVFAYFGFFSIIGELGIDRFLVRQISQNIENKRLIRDYINNCISLRFVLTLCALAVSLFISLFLPYDSTIRMGIILASIHYFFFFIAMVFIAYFQAHYHFANNVFSVTVGKMASLILMLLAVIFKRSLLFLIFLSSIAGIVTFLFMYFFIKREVKISFSINLRRWRSIIKKSSIIALTSFLNQFFFRIDIILLSVMIGSFSVGIYSLAYKIFENSALPASIFMAALFPVFARGFKKEKEKFRDKIKMVVIKIGIVGLFLSVLIFTFAHILIRFLGGEDFIYAVSVLRILAIALFFLYMSRLFSTLLISIGEEKKLMFIYFITALLNISCNFILIPKYSFIGAAYSALITQFFVMSFSLLAYRAKIRYK